MNTEPSVEIESTLAVARQHMLQRSSLPVLFLGAAAGTITLAVLWRHVAHLALFGWGLSLLLVLALRAWVGGRKAHQRPSFVWLVFLCHGLVWGALPWLVQINAHPEAMLYAALAVTAVASVALVSAALDRTSAAAFVCAALMPLLGSLSGLRGSEPAWGTAAAVLGFIALMALVARHGAALRLQKIKAALMEQARNAEVLRHLAVADSARNALANEHLLMQQLVQGTLQGYWHIDAKGIGLEANPAMCALLGRPPEQVIGRPLMDVFQDVPQRMREAEGALCPQSRPTSFEVDIVRSDGTRLHCHCNATPLFDAGGHRIGTVGLWTDLTASKQRENEFRTYERLANSLSDAVSVVGLDRRYRLVNDAWCNAVGLSREAALGREVSAAEFNKLPQDRLAAIETCFATGEVTTLSTSIKRQDGTLMLLQTTFTPFRECANADVVSSVILITRDTTAQERDRANALFNAEYLKCTLNATGEAIFATDAEGIDAPVRFVNEPMIRMWGLDGQRASTLTAADIMARALPQMANPDGETGRVRQVIERGVSGEGRVDLRDGRVMWWRGESAQIDGRPLRVWSFRDITLEERSRRLLHNVEAEQRALLDAFPGHMGRLDADLRFTYLNERLAGLFGASSEGLMGRQLVELATHDVAVDLLRAAQSALQGETVVMEHAVQGPTGAAQVQLTFTQGVEPLQGGTVVYLFGLDITDLKRAEASVRNSEAELRAVLKAFPGHIVTTDQDYHYVHLDEVIAQALGRPVKDIVGRHMREVLGEARFQANVVELEPVFKGKRVRAERSLPALGQRPAVELELTHVAGPRRADGRQLVYSFAVDITERKRTQAALAAARDEALAANQAKSRFLSHMSHELRTPMNAIAGFAQLLQMDPRAPLVAHQQNYVKQIRRGADHLLQLINGLLDLSSIEAGKLVLQPTTVRVAPFMEDLLNLITPLAQEKGVRLLPITGLELARQANWAVQVDRTRLRQVMLNLLGNAVKYSPAGSTVTLECRARDGQVEIAVQDTGPGLALEAQARLFRPFERLGAERGPVEGTGIGLALSRQLTVAMGGRIDVQSAPGHGSTFSIRLPLEAAAQPGPAMTGFAALDSGLFSSGAAAQVLYVDDNAVNLLLLESMLAQMPGLGVTTQLSAPQALQWALENQPDLILLDIHMPEMDGFELLARLKADARTANTPVVAVSADARAADIDHALACGFCEYLTKPLDLGLLQATVRRLLGRQPSHCAPLAAPAKA
jgi:PAS domain S-box-containing protein